MRLKEIKPGMVIHCKTKEEMEQLLEHLNEEKNADNLWDRHDSYGRTDCIRVGSDGLYCSFSSIGFYRDFGDEITEFSDLILPELSAEEVLEICHKICKGKSCVECLMRKNCFAGDEPDFKKVVEICEQWRAAHEKQEPEIEWKWHVEVRGDKYLYTGSFATEDEARAAIEEKVKAKIGAYGRYECICRVKQQESV